MSSKAIQSKLIAALQITQDDKGNERAGSLTQVNLTPEMKICGDGFNDRTVKIALDNSIYYVFRQDLFYLHSISQAMDARFGAALASSKLQ